MKLPQVPKTRSDNVRETPLEDSVPYDKTRRDLIKACLAGTVLGPVAATHGAGRETKSDLPQSESLKWARSVEGQRKGDLGDGTFLNPILSGDHPDPTIMKDGEDYYMTFSSFNSYPGIVIWHSKDLVNWRPVGPALSKNIGTVWALDICKHSDRFYVYIPAIPPGKPWSTFVIWADKIEGPWSDPIDLGIEGCIDPGHAVGEDGKRYLFVNGIRKIRLTDDGLATDGELEHAYSPWRYPEEWITENFAPEGPKLLRRGDYFYLVTAVGGTAGPVTGHMVIAARSRSIHGPWEHCPSNPLVRTLSEREPWWSRGHATVIEGPGGEWWMVYHGYENGFRTLGRQTLLEPIEWTEDGWFRAKGGDLGQPLPMPKGGEAVPHGFALSDEFSSNKFGVQWSFHDPSPNEMERVSYGSKSLELKGEGSSPVDSSPLTCIAVDRAYRVEVSMELHGEVEGGLFLFYNSKAFVGLGFTGNTVRTYQYAGTEDWANVPLEARKVRVRITNDRNVITYHYSTDNGNSWRLHPTRMEVSGLHHNVFGGFLSLRIGICSFGTGKVKLSQFSYRATEETI
ncbi:glycosyl hydrolase, family 43 [Verrucomicrobiia bacterium DG1235]|nr:glycosyl hydrolase, family 43 [Verrucomicrobiae bacterium DG1235]